MSCPVAMATARGYLHDMLAVVFRRPLDATRLESFRNAEMLAAMAAAGINLGKEFAADADCGLLDRLAVDYTQLFHGPGEHIAPYESIQLGAGDELMGPGAGAVRRFMAEHGFSVAAESGEMPDHISVELAFMGELARREARARVAGDRETLDLVTDLQRRFLDEHLGRWVGRLARKIRREAQTPFYREMAKLLDDFVADEQQAAITAA